MALQIPARFGDRPLVTRALLEHAHARGVQVHVWTINEMAEIEALLELGVDGLVSDFPARVVAARERRA
jgi:glycerophosphoryl diester phosphodiesterase